MTLGVLVPMLDDGAATPPEALPIGRVALALATEGIDLVFGQLASKQRMTGFRARPGHWEAAASVPVAGAYDRYPSKLDPAGHEALTQALGSLPLVNPLSLTVLCRDKLLCQRHLEAHGVPVPEVEHDPRRFEARLQEWGAAFCKPRYGAFGIGISRVVPGDDLPHEAPGARGGPPEPTLLQRAVPPPAGWAGVSVRVLAQRDVDGRWVVNPMVARRHHSDPVVNVARGAQAAPGDDVLSASTVLLANQAALRTAEALSQHPDGAWLAELGVDLAIDDAGVPWVIEVNSRPRGRLESLARAFPDRYGAAHLAACARPLRFLAARAGGG